MNKFLNPTVLLGWPMGKLIGHFQTNSENRSQKTKILEKSHLWPKSLKYSIPFTKILLAILQKTLFFRFEPGKWVKIQKNILSNFHFIAAILIFFRFRANHDFVTPGDTPVPVKILFLDFRPGKTHIGPKNNSKQLLRRCCYTHFFSFACKLRFCARKC